MKRITCCFTGHRNIPPEQLNTVAKRLEEAVMMSIEQGYRYFGVGGAIGFDMLAAKTVLKLRVQYPTIRLILVLPCHEHDKYWNRKDKADLKSIMGTADKIVYVSKNYSNECMFKRNRHLVENSCLCICYLTKSSGGTAYTVEYAKRSGCRVVNVAE